MPVTIDAAEEMALELSPALRELLAYRLLESIGKEEEFADDPEIEKAWELESKRRIEEYDSGKAVTYSLEEVIARMDEIIAGKRKPGSRSELGRE